MRRRSVPGYTVHVSAPIHAINMTPVIDVMLVLLIMFIITTPVLTHKVTIDLPSEGDPPTTQTEPMIVRLALDNAGTLRWNGAVVAEASLPPLLAGLRRHPEAQLELSAAADTRYELYDRVLGNVKRARIDRIGLVGNAGFAETLDR